MNPHPATPQADVASPDPLIAVGSSTARSSIVVAVGQLASSVLGGVFAVLVGIIAGQGDKTDGFIAAYSAYLILILLGSTMRVSLIPQLGSTSDPAGFRAESQKRVGQILPIAFVVSLLFVAAAPLLGPLLRYNGSPAAQHAASISIALLGVAALCQIWSAVLSSVLGAARRFVSSTMLYVMSSLVMLAGAVILITSFGVTGAAIGVVVAAAALVLGHIVYLQRLEFTAWPQPKTLLQKDSWLVTGKVASASMLTMMLQLNLSVSIAVVSAPAGTTTAYAYAYLATVMITGITASTIGLVTMPNLVESLERHGASVARNYLRETAAFGTFLYVPIAVGYACFGRPIANAALAGALDPPTLDFFWDASRIFLLMGLLWAMYTPLITLSLSQRRYARLAAVVAIMIPLHAAIAIAIHGQGPTWVAWGHALSGSLLMVVLLVVMMGRDALSVGWGVIVAVSPCLPLAAIYVLPSLLLGPVTTVAGSIAALAICTIVYVLVGTRLWKSTGGRMLELLLARSPG